jgi:hypothetical protein
VPQIEFHSELSSGSPLGIIIFDGYRTLDGKNFYHDDGSAKIATPPSGIFSAVGDGNSDSRSTLSFNPFSAISSNPGSTGSGTGFAGGKDSFGPSFGGSKEGFSFSGSSFSRGSNPLNFAYTNLLADHGDFQGFGNAGGGDGKIEAAATPLPPVWTLMLIGLGCLGFIAHRVRRNESACAAA